MNAATVIAWFLLISGIGTLGVLVFICRRLQAQSNVLVTAAAMVPVAGWAMFYGLVLWDGVSLDSLRTLSRWLIVVAFAAATFQGWVLYYRESHDG